MRRRHRGRCRDRCRDRCRGDPAGWLVSRGHQRHRHAAARAAAHRCPVRDRFAGLGAHRTAQPSPSPAPSAAVGATASASPAPAPTRPPGPVATGRLIVTNGIARPDTSLTPGEAYADTSLAQICASAAPPVPGVSDTLRRAVFSEYALPYPPPSSGAYQVDHLIPVALGGDDSIKNLWPQPAGGTAPGYAAKDRLETTLHGMVCSGRLDLGTARLAVASDWYAAYRTYVEGASPAS